MRLNCDRFEQVGQPRHVGEAGCERLLRSSDGEREGGQFEDVREDFHARVCEPIEAGASVKGHTMADGGAVGAPTGILSAVGRQHGTAMAGMKDRRALERKLACSRGCGWAFK